MFRSTAEQMPGVDVMITIFCDFCQFSAKKIGVFLKNQCYDNNFLRFLTIFGEKIGVFLKNQCYDQNFAYFSFVLSQKRHFFR
jgi:hypothetical protein